MLASQIGKTEMLLNTIGFYACTDPDSILAVLETEKKADIFAGRFASMVKDTPALRSRISTARGPSTDNTKHHKNFPGGFIEIVTAGSDANLTSLAIRLLVMDEVDKYGTTKSGDPVELAINRTTTYRHRRKIVRISTPLDKHNSRIEAAYLQSDQRKYNVPCPHCGVLQILVFGNLKFQRKEGDALEVENVFYECEHCHAPIEHRKKREMLSKGKWIAEKPFRGHAGFWLSVLYSPWVSWKEVSEKFLKANRFQETLRVFINEQLAESWEEKKDKVDEQSLFGRRETYGPQIPFGVGLLTAAADVQDNRIEATLIGWGRGEESWIIEHATFYGDPAQIEDDCWVNLEAWLMKERIHENGQPMSIDCTFIDSGYLAKIVYKFCAGKAGRRIFAIKGEDGRRRYITERPKRKQKADIVIIAVDMVKEILNSRLKLKINADTDTGVIPHGYIHFPVGYGTDIEYFQQLTNEVPLWKKDRSGRPYKSWWLPPGKRAESWDCFVYGYAALEFLKIRDIGKFVDQYKGEKVFTPVPQEPLEKPIAITKEAQPEVVEAETEEINTLFIDREPRRASWANRWK